MENTTGCQVWVCPGSLGEGHGGHGLSETDLAPETKLPERQSQSAFTGVLYVKFRAVRWHCYETMNQLLYHIKTYQEMKNSFIFLIHN